VEKNTVIAGEMGEFGLGIEGGLRRAARSLIEQAIEAKVAVFLEEFGKVNHSGGWRH